MIGKTLGPYQIVDLLGEGGMGEVYRARDPRLGRDVAIKVLPASFSADSDRLHRFEQEARAAAALNHPNILAVHDIGTHEGAPYIVSELLQGETLRISPGGLPVRKATDYALQIARGLAAAHEKGIVHRDLKPQNIFVTTDSRVKILDFGLAKLTQTDSSVEAPTVLPTSPAINTQAGMVLGTMGYMAPEQVRGLTVDHRADIFAFGTVLYEMLSGRRAFQGATAADTMIAIVKEDPADLPLAERNIPPALERIVDRCLEKSPSARFQTASDLAFAIEALSSHSDRTQIAAASPATPPARSRVRLPWLIAAGLALALLGTGAVALLHLREAPPAVHPVQFQVRLPAGTTLVQNAPIEISPDGQQVVFGAGVQGVSSLWLRSLSSLEARRLPGSEGALWPFWSPDSRSVAFFAEGKLKKLPLAGGPPFVLCDAPGATGGTWSGDGNILFATGTGSGIQKIPSTGGAPVAVTKLQNGEVGHRWPYLLPGGRHFLMLAVATAVDLSGELFVVSLDSGDRTALGPSDSNGIYGSGHLLFTRNGTLVAQPFDAAQGVLAGEPFPVAEQVETIAATRKAPISVSDSGVLGYRRGRVQATLTWFDRGGRVTGTVGDDGGYFNLALSPDDRRLAVAMGTESTKNIDIWVFDFERPGTPTRLTTTAGAEFDPAWSPDGSEIMFTSTREGSFDLYRRPSNGSGEDRLVLKKSAGGPQYSPEGRLATFTSGSDVWLLSLSGEAEARPLLQTQFNEGDPAISPDGRWLAYHSNETGPAQIYVQAFPGGGRKSRISEAGGTEPRWNGDGTELFFLAPGGILMAAGIDTANGFRVKTPQALFPTGIASNQNNHPYAVTKDGKRFLVASSRELEDSQMTITLNWLAAARK